MNFREAEDLKWPTPGSVPFLEVLQSIASEANFSDVKRFI